MLVNGKQGNLIGIRDRGLLYGDGVFRTFLAKNGQVRLWPLHFQKLQHDCAKLGIICPDVVLLSAQLNDLVMRQPDGVMKLIVTRGERTRGYAPPTNGESTIIWDVSPLPVYPDSWTTHGIIVRLCQLRLSQQPRLAGIKHLNRLENVLAAAELSDTGLCDEKFAEGLMLDTANNIIEGTRSNLFLVSQGKLLTPDLSNCGVAGVQRERVMTWATQHNMPLQVCDIGLDDVMHADELFVVNSVIGLWSIRELGKRRWLEFPVAKQIRLDLDGPDSQSATPDSGS
jgi:4-amino-4-deoxychorismate lyase